MAVITDCSIIIVNYNQAQLTTACLESLGKLVVPQDVKLHIIVVDNGSPQVYQLPRSVASLHSVTILRSEPNLGFTGGNNMGIHAAIERFNSDFVWLLNNDTELDRQALTLLLNWAITHPSQGIISSKIYFYPASEFHKAAYSRSARGKILWYAGGSIDWRNVLCFHRGVDEVDQGQFAAQETSDFATGCSLLIRREVLEKIGLLNKDYFLYLEDVDWSLRCQQFGYQVGYCNQAVVWHKNAGSTGGSGSPTQTYYQTRNRFRLFAQYGSWRTRLTLIHLAWLIVTHGTATERLALRHALTGGFGKQPLS